MIYTFFFLFQALLQCYKTLHNAYVKIVDVNRTGRRLLGKYYRVAFFGSVSIIYLIFYICEIYYFLINTVIAESCVVFQIF